MLIHRTRSGVIPLVVVRRHKLGKEPPDHVIARLAAAQEGVASARQLLHEGVTRGEIRARLNDQRLHVVFRGVYSVMPLNLLTARARIRAAEMTTGKDTAVALGFAGYLHEIAPVPSGRIELLNPHSGHDRTGIRVRRDPSLDDLDVTVRHGIRLTSVARTILDLSANKGDRPVERAIQQAIYEGIFDLNEIHAAVERHPRHRGIPRLKRVLAIPNLGSTPTLSNYEEDFFALMDRAGLPRPDSNVPMTLSDGTPIIVDFLWRRHRLIVEIDDPSHEHKRLADAHRDLLLRTAGYTVIRFLTRDLSLRGGHVVAVVALALAQDALGTAAAAR